MMTDKAITPGGNGPIEIRINDRSQLFNSLDPFPFPERDLDDNAEEFIVGWARELPREQTIRIVLHLPRAMCDLPEAKDVAPAMQAYFAYRTGVIQLALNELFRVGRLSLFIGILVLGTALFITQMIAGRLGESPLARFFQESLIIVAWVANWRPIETFLYDWWPIVRRRNLYRRLAQAEVELRPY